MTKIVDGNNVVTSRRAALVYALGPVILAGCGGGGSDSPALPVADAPAPPPTPAPLAPPAFVQHPAGMTVLAGRTASFSAGVSNGTGASYQWLRNGAEIAGATQATLTIAQASLLDTGSVYSVRVTNAAASVTSQGAVLAVTSPPFTVVPLLVQGIGRGFLAAADNAGNMALSVPSVRVAPDGTLKPLFGSQFFLDTPYDGPG
ncbi:MAG: hypothetical protein JWQ33_1562, partial [Ramlibacter sp.]|nr:hypothetical protein [Ramlibacter sp.]